MGLAATAKIAVLLTVMPQPLNHQVIHQGPQQHVRVLAHARGQPHGVDQTHEVHTVLRQIEAAHPHGLVENRKMVAVAHAKRVSAATRNEGKEHGQGQCPQCSKTDGHPQEDDHRTKEKLLLTPRLTAVTRIMNQQSIDPLPHRLVHCVNSIDYGFAIREVQRILLRKSYCLTRAVVV